MRTEAARVIGALLGGLCVLSTVLVGRPALAEPGAVRNYVVIVGNNQSVEATTPPLNYADDDAAKFYELFSPVSKQVVLFSVMDDSTQRLHPALPARSRAPTRENLFVELAAINVQMEQDRARGEVPVLLFIYIGHGHIGGDGGGYVSFLDGAMTGAELIEKVVAPSKASFNHLIFDACNSYLLIAGRGDQDDSGPDLKEAMRSYLDQRSLARYPNTGFLFSTRQAKETHEWSVFQGGVFSHEVRSGLAGAADVNADGRIEYSELDAFLAAANLAVADPKARLEAFIQAPALDRNVAVVDLGASGFANYLRLPASFSGRFYLEDVRGVRYIDGNKTTEAPVYLALLGGRDYYLRHGDLEARISTRQKGTVDLASLSFGRPGQSARGSVAEEFRQSLFGIPYGPGFYQGFVAQTAQLPARKAERPFPPPELKERASSQPLKNPYLRR